MSDLLILCAMEEAKSFSDGEHAWIAKEKLGVTACFLSSPTTHLIMMSASLSLRGHLFLLFALKSNYNLATRSVVSMFAQPNTREGKDATC